MTTWRHHFHHIKMTRSDRVTRASTTLLLVLSTNDRNDGGYHLWISSRMPALLYVEISSSMGFRFRLAMGNRSSLSLAVCCMIYNTMVTKSCVTMGFYYNVLQTLSIVIVFVQDTFRHRPVVPRVVAWNVILEWIV